jgi:hypothetical protein
MTPAELKPNRDEIEIFVDALFRHAGREGFVSLRSFFDDDQASKPFRITPTALTGGLKPIIEGAEDDVYRGANNPKRVVFCPPIAVFSNREHAGERDLLRGLALSVECDQQPEMARLALEQILGPATVIVASGGQWTDPTTKTEQAKLHLHWRLQQPAQGKDLATLKVARDMATRIVGGDPSNKPVCHPIRWPGSWHRKREPVLCRIVAQNPDSEIDLVTAHEALSAFAPPPKAKSNGGAGEAYTAGDGEDWHVSVAKITSGESFHGPLVSLSAKLVASGMNDGASVNLLRGFMAATRAAKDERWQARYDDIPRAVRTAREKYGQEDEVKEPLRFEPISTFRDPATIPRRQWLYGRQYIKGNVSATIADGGIGKTNLEIAEGIALATGRNILGVNVPERQRVLYWNGEESLDEIERRVHAVCQHHQIDPSELTGKFFMMSGFDCPIVLARMKQGTLVFDQSCMAMLEEMITRLQIGVLMLDPFVALHRVPENDNTNIEAIVGWLAALAHRCQIAIDIDHHIRKPNTNSSGDTSVADARGAGALVNKARVARVLNRMSAGQAQTAKVTDHREYLRADNGKANYAPAFAATWFKMVPIALPNGDSVAALEAWEYPGAFDAVRPEHIEAVRAMVRSNDNYRADPQSPEWIGRVIADVVGLDADSEGDQASLKTIIKTWIANKMLFKVTRKDETRRPRVFITADPPSVGEDLLSNIVPVDFGQQSKPKDEPRA